MVSHPNRNKALDLLKTTGITAGPVDINLIASYLGFKICPVTLHPKQKGAVFAQGKTRIIVVNENHPLSLQRYTVGHELGHFVNGDNHAESEPIETEFRFLSHHFQQERSADAFAAELLMPKEFLEVDLRKYGLDIPKLLEIYQVSEKALWIRLNTLRLAEKYQAKV